jgi:hypothetical protein
MAVLKSIKKTCEVCSAEFFVSKSAERIHKPRFCSPKCCGESRRGKTTHTQTIEEILATRVDKTSGCWIWTGSRSSTGTDGGYGELRYNNKLYHVHRLSWSIHNKQEIPSNMEVCHECDMPPCFNPDHLFLGTHKDNMQDMARKGRSGILRGTDSLSAKLNEEKVLEIRRIHSEGSLGYRKLATMFGVDRSTIRSIVIREKWTHI